MKVTKSSATLSKSLDKTTKSKSIIPAKDTVKLNLTQVPKQKDADIEMSLQQILAYYRSRVEAFEKDRTQWYQKLEVIKVKQESVHKASWELKKRQDEKLELERAMQQCQNVLYHDREKLIKMKQVTDMLKIKGKENRHVILELLEANNSVEQHVFYQRDGAPERIQSYSKKTLGKPLNQTEINLRKEIVDHKKNPAINYDYKQPNVLRTIHLPSDQLGQMKVEVEELHMHIQEQRVHYENILAKLRDDKAQFEEDQRVKYLSNVEEVETLIKRLQDQETFNYQIVKDHVDLISQYEVEERRLQEELEGIRVENSQLREQIKAVSMTTQTKKNDSKSEYEKNVHEYQQKFREQSRIQQENITIIKDQYKKVQEIYKRKMIDMNERLEKDTKKLQTVDRRRKLDLEGYQADLQAMKKKVLFYQKYISKLKKLVDEEGQSDAFQVDDVDENDQ